MSDYLSELRKAIKAVHGCDASHLDTAPVNEVFRGSVAWSGEVEVFAITGHPKAKQCFAWGVRRDDGKGWDVTTVLAVHPVTTPEIAVKAAIAAYARQQTPPRPRAS